MTSSFRRAIGPGTLALECGKLAQQANGSVLIRSGDNVVLVAATMSVPREGIDFFPLTIELEERLYARGRIPGSFFRREGRPSSHGTLIARLTDRPIRPLFPKGFRNEIQVVLTPLSVDLESPFDTLALMGASAALAISDIPFEGPIGATRMGYVNGDFVVNPTYKQLEESRLDLVVAGARDGVLMMEAGALEMPEDLVLEAIRRAQAVNREAIAFQEEVARSVGKPKVSFKVESLPSELGERVAKILDGRLRAALSSSVGKADQASQLDAAKTQLLQQLGGDYKARDIIEAYEALLEKEFRNRVLKEGKRPDGRGTREIRPISCEVAVLPRTHGTGLFTRGETQVLAVTTLGSIGDAQKLDTLSPEERRRFMLHYNFPPYSTGEVKRLGSPGRREIGHGALSERALTPVLPDEQEFPYTIRVVSEVLSSNGSTSMGSVCASTLALMDAGVPIKSPIAGISVGLITGDDGKYVTLTDIQGMEDHMGDMDFKVAGSEKGITAIQLDIKVKSISLDIVREALEQAREARLFLLQRMREAISETRAELSQYAPRMVRITIPVDKIGIVIGPGGKTIRGIVEQTKATVDIADDGTVTIGSPDQAAVKRAIELIENLTREVKVGDIYTGKVVRITNFGAFVEILPGKDGMVHISELADHRIPSVEDAVRLGEQITVIVKEIDAMGRVNLSRRALLQGGGESPGGPDGPEPPVARPKPEEQRSGYRSSGGRPPQQRNRPGGPRPPGPRQGGGPRFGHRPGGGRPAP